jgi:hypothetical protein
MKGRDHSEGLGIVVRVVVSELNLEEIRVGGCVVELLSSGWRIVIDSSEMEPTCYMKGQQTKYSISFSKKNNKSFLQCFVS